MSQVTDGDDPLLPSEQQLLSAVEMNRGKTPGRFIYIIRNKAHSFDINVRLLKGLAFGVMCAFMICVDSLCLTLTDPNS